MQRKQFLGFSASLISGGALPLKKLIDANDDEETVYLKPPYLKPGDTIGITSPAGYITEEEIRPAMLVMEGWGYKIEIGTTIGKRDFTRGGTDAERAADFQQMLDDASIKAIMCARGGYGSIGIVDKLNWIKFKSKPKWIIGFSDVTILHSHIHRNCQVASIHSKMCNSFPDDWNRAEAIQILTIKSIRDALKGTKMKYNAVPNPQNKLGIGEGTLAGGNLKTPKRFQALHQISAQRTKYYL
jgi:muramoyltetrapeptide carboxypeptidase